LQKSWNNLVRADHPALFSGLASKSSSSNSRDDHRPQIESMDSNVLLSSDWRHHFETIGKNQSIFAARKEG